MPVLAAVEGGGTTYVVAIAKDKPENIIERASFPTTTPEETLAKCKAWLAQRSFDALGIATFGPVDPEHHQRRMATSRKHQKIVEGRRRRAP